MQLTKYPQIFSFKRTTSVQEVLHGFGRLNIKHLMVLVKVMFNRKMWLKRNLLHDVFSVLSVGQLRE